MKGLLDADFQVIIGSRSLEKVKEAAAKLTVEQGADTAVWLATVDRVKDSGKLWRDCEASRRHRSIASF